MLKKMVALSIISLFISNVSHAETTDILVSEKKLAPFYEEFFHDFQAELDNEKEQTKEVNLGSTLENYQNKKKFDANMFGQLLDEFE